MLITAVKLRLTEQIQDLIQLGKIKSWEWTGTGFTHKAEQFGGLCEFRETKRGGKFLLYLCEGSSPASGKWQAVYPDYHGKFTEMLSCHFNNQVELVQVHMKPTGDEMTDTSGNAVKRR
jgi:hypothetical protein